jgi:hypothetical protein
MVMSLAPNLIFCAPDYTFCSFEIILAIGSFFLTTAVLEVLRKGQVTHCFLKYVLPVRLWAVE